MTTGRDLLLKKPSVPQIDIWRYRGAERYEEQQAIGDWERKYGRIPPPPIEPVSRKEADEWYQQEQVRIAEQYQDIADWTQEGWQQRREENPLRVQEWQKATQDAYEQYQERLPGIEESIFGKYALPAIEAPFKLVGGATRGAFVSPPLTEREMGFREEQSARVKDLLSQYKSGKITRVQYDKQVKELSTVFEKVAPTPAELETRRVEEYEQLPIWEQLLWESPMFLGFGIQVAKLGGKTITKGVTVSFNKAFGKQWNRWIFQQASRPPQYQSQLFRALGTKGFRDSLARTAVSHLKRSPKNVAKAVDDTFRDLDNVLIPRATVSGITRGGLPTINQPAWDAMAVAERTALATSKGLSGQVGSKVWANLTGAEVTAITKVPTVAPVTPEVTQETERYSRMRGRTSRELESYPDEPVLLSQRGESEAFLATQGKGSIEMARQDIQFARTSWEKSYGGRTSNPQMESAILQAEKVLSESVAIIEAKPITPEVTRIPKELTSLAEEAKKYATFEEFEKAIFSEEWRNEWRYKEGLLGNVATMGFPKATELATEGKYVISGRSGIRAFWESAQTEPVAIPKAEVTPQASTQHIRNIQEQGRTDPESVSPEDAKLSHIELASPDGPKIPKPPTEVREPDDIFREIADKATKGERPDQTLLRRHQGAIDSEGNRTSIIIKEGGEKLRAQGIGVVTRAQLVPLKKDIAKLDELYKALHNPSGVEAGTIKIPEGLENIYRELRTLTDWEQYARLDFDPEMATVHDYFYRGWKPPEDAFTDVVQGRPLVKTPTFKKPRVNATYQEMRDAGFEPLFWNPYQQWGLSRMQGVKYREQMELVSHLKSMGEEFIRPHDGGAIPEGWRVPEVGPAFEGKPFAIEDPVNGSPMVMYSRRWIVQGKIANSLENIYGKRIDLGKFVIKGKTIDPMAIIDALTFIPKRAKLFASYFQQVDFLTRSGSGGWTRAVDALLAGQPIESAKAVVQIPASAFKIIRSNFSPTERLKLVKQLDSTTPLIEGRLGINLRGISEAGLSTRDVTIFPADMDKLVHQMASETGVLGLGRGFARMVGDIESAMRRGLFEGVYPAAIITDIQNNIAPMVYRQYSSLNDAQINGMIARIANIKYSTIPASQSVFQNRVLRETLRRVFFSIGESEGLLRQATGAFKGPYASFWRKHWIGVYLFLIVTANIIHFASTGEPLPPERYTPIAKTKWGPLPFGYNREFASPTLPWKGRGGVELTLDLAGQLDTAFRVLDPVNFISSRESVPVRAAWNQIAGTDFYGAPIDDVGPGGVISRTSQLLFDLFAPIGVGGLGAEAIRQVIPGAEEIVPEIEERVGFVGLFIQATGINIKAETTKSLLDRFASESGMLKADDSPVESWDDLEPFQKNELSTNEALQTELGLRSKVSVERQQLGALGFATLDELDQERIVRGEALVSEFFSDSRGKEREEYSQLASTFRDEVRLLKREISSRKAQVDYDFGLFEETGVLPTDPNKKALVQYYNTFDLVKRPSGVIDWDKQEALEVSLRKHWTSSQETYVDRNIGLTEWGTLMAEYNKAVELLGKYWEVPTKQRESYRKQHPEVDAALVRWYGYKPVTAQPTTTSARPRTSVGNTGRDLLLK